LRAQQELLHNWRSWTNFFDRLDTNGYTLGDLCSALEEKVEAEDYAAAADLKKQILGLVTNDPAADLRLQMQEALQREDYGTVARLRNEGWAWLEGWWASEDGQLLRVAPE
jgi:hypothetical protein